MLKKSDYKKFKPTLRALMTIDRKSGKSSEKLTAMPYKTTTHTWPKRRNVSKKSSRQNGRSFTVSAVYNRQLSFIPPSTPSNNVWACQLCAMRLTGRARLNWQRCIISALTWLHQMLASPQSSSKWISSWLFWIMSRCGWKKLKRLISWDKSSYRHWSSIINSGSLRRKMRLKCELRSRTDN